MHLNHLLNHPDSSDFCKLSFIALTRSYVGGNEFFYYFEYIENHDQPPIPIQRIRKINLTLPVTNCWIVGSCHGLICLARYQEEIVCICNPFTRELVVLPKIKTDSDTYCSFGFGFVSSTNEYKVVRICYHGTTYFAQVHIYTVGSGHRWRYIGNFDPQVTTDPCGLAYFANGALYWLNEELKMITTFDFAKEKFCQNLSPPPLSPDSNWDLCTIGVLDGLLFFSTFRDLKQDIWLLEKKNHDHERKEQPEEHQSMVWSREFRIDTSELLAITKTKGVLTCMDNYLKAYNTKASTSKSLVDFKEQIAQVIPHKNTLLSLKRLGEEDTKIMESIEIEETESLDKPSVIEG